jgi:hypothetical protein
MCTSVPIPTPTRTDHPDSRARRAAPVTAPSPLSPASPRGAREEHGGSAGFGSPRPPAGRGPSALGPTSDGDGVGQSTARTVGCPGSTSSEADPEPGRGARWTPESLRTRRVAGGSPRRGQSPWKERRRAPARAPSRDPSAEQRLEGDRPPRMGPEGHRGHTRGSEGPGWDPATEGPASRRSGWMSHIQARSGDRPPGVASAPGRTWRPVRWLEHPDLDEETPR